jgi:hypothetical protein
MKYFIVKFYNKSTQVTVHAVRQGTDRQGTRARNGTVYGMKGVVHNIHTNHSENTGAI